MNEHPTPNPIDWDSEDPNLAFGEIISDYSQAPAHLIENLHASLPDKDASAEFVELHWVGKMPDDPLVEACRVLKPGGVLAAMTTGESHRIELQEIFGRGANWPPIKPVRFAIPEKLTELGLELISFAEYYGARYYESPEDCAATLGPGSVVPDFGSEKDAIFIKELKRLLSTERGIRETEHWAIFVACKPDARAEA